MMITSEGNEDIDHDEVEFLIFIMFKLQSYVFYLEIRNLSLYSIIVETEAYWYYSLLNQNA